MVNLSRWFLVTWDWLVASDPGLTRLWMAGSTIIAVASALGVEFGFAQMTHAGAKGSIISMLLGAIVSMMGLMALKENGVWKNVRIAIFFPVALGIGMVTSIFVNGHPVLMKLLFVVVMFAAVAIRRFGMPFFFYGFMGWMGYFFASFLHASFGMVPKLLSAIVVATIWVLFLALTFLRTNPEKALRRTVKAFAARARTFIQVCADLLEDTTPNQRESLLNRLHTRKSQLAEAALMVEGWSAEPHSLPKGESAPALRRHLIETQHLLDRLAAYAEILSQSSDELKKLAAQTARQIGWRDYKRAKGSIEQLLQACNQDKDDLKEAQLAACQFADAALEFIELAEWVVAPSESEVDTSKHTTNDFEPVVGLAMGNLPGSQAVAQDVPARGERWNPLARLDMTNRQAIQVSLAGGLSIILGSVLSPVRYYWAVIAAFVMFTGTATRGETFIKGLNRVLGTLIGLAVSIGLALLTNGHTPWVLITILVSIFCGFYLMRVSYAYMIFFITIMIGQLYSIMNLFSPGLLMLRLGETLIGAVVGFVVALLVVPLSTQDTVKAARDNLFDTLSELLEAAANKIDPQEDKKHNKDQTQKGSQEHKGKQEQMENQEQEQKEDQEQIENQAQNLDVLTRTLDDRLRQLSLIAKPFRRPLMWGYSPSVRHRLTIYNNIVTGARALSIALRKSDNENNLELAKACREFAEEVKTLKGSTSKRSAQSAKEPISDILNDIPLSLKETLVVDPVIRRLIHLEQLVYDLKTNPMKAL